VLVIGGGAFAKSHNPLGVHEYAVGVGLYATAASAFARPPCFANSVAFGILVEFVASRLRA